ncbi:MAG TPA: hypothetical protein VE733_29845, partial [Streptosporangiaceae bacterium]|nr:hypothetical protein [Streptosporangiaceae bacterium]
MTSGPHVPGNAPLGLPALGQQAQRAPTRHLGYEAPPGRPRWALWARQARRGAHAAPRAHHTGSMRMDQAREGRYRQG